MVEIKLDLKNVCDMQKLDKTIFMGIEKVYTSHLRKVTPSKTGFHAREWDTLNLGGFNYMIVNPYGDVITYLEEGTTAHTIKPKNKKMLKFPINKRPTLRNPKEQQRFAKKGLIFFYGRGRKPVLGFEKKGGQYYVYAKEVKHPGFEGKWFIKDTMDSPELYQEFRDFVKARIHQFQA